MFAGLVVVAGTVHFAVVLCDVEVDGPRAELVGHLLVSRPEFLGAIAFLQQRVLRCVVAKRVKVCVREVGLETQRLGHPNAFEHVEHIFPTMHTSPANFALGGKALAVAGGDGCGFLEGLDDLCRVGCGILAPFLDTELG